MRLCTVLVFILSVSLLGSGQQLHRIRPRPIPPMKNAGAGLRQIVRSSGVIFSGVVTRVQRSPAPLISSPAAASGRLSGAAVITFRVENAIRGVRRGQSFQLREWEGLWLSGERYQIGERVFLFLYPTSKIGLSSPVGGTLGKYSVTNSGTVLASPAGILAQPLSLKSFIAQIARAESE